MGDGSVPADWVCRAIDFDQFGGAGGDGGGAGKLERVPEGFLLMAPQRVWPILQSPILSLFGKARLASEFFVKARRSSENDDESVASFARRRLGRETFERLVQPLVGGIYTADPEKLSLAATLPRFLEMERQHGGLIRAARARARSQESGDSGARYSLFVAPREGMSSLVEAITARLPAGCVRLKAAITRIERVGEKWRVHAATTDTVRPITEFDGLIVATPAAAAAKMLMGIDSSLAAELAAIEFAGSAVVALGYDRAQIAARLDSFGFVVPAIEGRQILSASFSSVKFPERAPAGKELIRVFIGGALQAKTAGVDRRPALQDCRRRIARVIGHCG